MTYTSDQYAILQRLESGLMYDDLTEAEREVLRYLDQSGLVQPRADIRDGYYTISQAGARVLAERRAELQGSEKVAQQYAEQKEHRNFQKKITVLTSLIAFVSFLFGVILEHFAGVVDFLAKLVSPFFLHS